MHDTKITIKKRGKVWDVKCPHCFKPYGALYIFGSFTTAIASARTHLRTRHTTHRAYIAWPRIAGEPVARCHDCTWVNTTAPFSAAAAHLLEGATQ